MILRNFIIYKTLIKRIFSHPFASAKLERDFIEEQRARAVFVFPIVLSCLLAGWSLIWLITCFYGFSWISLPVKILITSAVGSLAYLLFKFRGLIRYFSTYYFENIVVSLTIILSVSIAYFDYRFRSPSEPGLLYASLIAQSYIQILGLFIFIRPRLTLGIPLAVWVMGVGIFTIWLAYPIDHESLFMVIIYELFSIIMGLVCFFIARRTDRHLFLMNEKIARTTELKIRLRSQQIGDLAKNRFLATLGHEIRTPMSAIKSMIDLFRIRNLLVNEKDQKLAQSLVASCDRLLNTLNDMLDYAQAEEQLRLSLRVFNILEIKNGIESLFLEMAKLKNITIDVISEDVHHQSLYGDFEKLFRVICNMVSNSIKFTDRGGVTIIIQCHAKNATSVVLSVKVIDTGIGISEANIKYIFNPFYQVDAESNRKFQGNGLGLAICKQIVQSMNGLLKVESILGVGSKFYIEVPLQYAPI